MRSGLPRKFGVLIVSVRRTISGTVRAPVVPVELGLAQLFQTKPQGPIYRPMRLGRCGWERLACSLPSPAMVKEESLRGDSDLWVSSWGSRLSPKPAERRTPGFPMRTPHSAAGQAPCRDETGSKPVLSGLKRSSPASEQARTSRSQAAHPRPA